MKTQQQEHTAIYRWLDKGFNLKTLQKSRLPWVDYLRGIAILLVVYRHALIGIQRSGLEVPSSLVTANMIFYSFRMPLFFILSGIFVQGSLAKRSLRELIGIKFENLIYPYLIWTFLQVTLQIVFSSFTNSARGFIDYTYILYHPRNLDQFWYLPALFNTTVVYLIIKEKFKPPVWTQLLFGLVLYFLSPRFQNISMLSDFMEFYIFFAFGNAIASAFLHESTQRFLRKPYLLLILIPLFAAVQLYYLRHDEFYYVNNWWGKTEFIAIALIGCFTMLVFAMRLQAWNILSFLRIYGYHSLYIYVMHVFVAAATRIVLTRVFGLHQPVLLLFLCILLGATIPVLFYNLLIKDNIFWFLFSYKRKRRKAEVAPVKVKEAYVSQ
jgi:fucose 4-O-acetylase-like acetyltransferase